MNKPQFEHFLLLNQLFLAMNKLRIFFLYFSECLFQRKNLFFNPHSFALKTSLQISIGFKSDHLYISLHGDRSFKLVYLDCLFYLVQLVSILAGIYDSLLKLRFSNTKHLIVLF